MSLYLQKACVLIWLNMLTLRCNVFEKGEIDGRIRVLRPVLNVF